MIFKLLVVDDETTVRKGIANFMNWAAIDCEVAGTACDGLEAIEFLQRHPVDIVITDIKMPEADGLELAKYIHEQRLSVQVILLTGYADFAYAQTAIRYNVSSFLLKPTNKKSLFEAVQKAQKALITSGKNSASRKEEIAFLKDQLLQEMTDQPFSPAFSDRLQAFGLSLEHYCVAAFQSESSGESISALKRIIIAEKINGYCYRYGNFILTVYFADDASQLSLQRIKENCLDILAIAGTLSKKVTVGISRQHTQAATFGTAAAEAIAALSLNFYSEENISLFSSFPDVGTHGLTAENSMDLLQFENSLNDWKFEEAHTILHTIFMKFKNSFVNANDSKTICSQIYYLCSRVLIRKGLPAPEDRYLQQIYTASDIFFLESVTASLLDETCACLSGWSLRQNRLVENAMEYIQSHLSDSLSLEELAEHLHISPSHLSRTFKKNCRQSLTDYINNERIAKAKEYLETTDRLTYEIAELIGYKDATYFSSIFKKYTGLTPTEYRQSRFRHQTAPAPAHCTPETHR